jgi:hypothetical protein
MKGPGAIMRSLSTLSVLLLAVWMALANPGPDTAEAEQKAPSGFSHS